MDVPQEALLVEQDWRLPPAQREEAPHLLDCHEIENTRFTLGLVGGVGSHGGKIIRCAQRKVHP